MYKRIGCHSESSYSPSSGITCLGNPESQHGLYLDTAKPALVARVQIESYMQPARVLCVDDDLGILQTLPMVLKAHGYEVTTAGSVPEALNIITSGQQFDVLISDLNMGHVADGFTVVHTMRRVNPKCVNLILTGYPAFESALQALRLQVDDYLTKPSDIPKMMETISRKLSDREACRLPAPCGAFRQFCATT